MTQQLVFAKYGVLIKFGEDKYARHITRAFFDSTENDYLVLEGDFQQGPTFPVTIEDVSIDENTGIIKFQAFDADYMIRELREEDGYWLSKYKTMLPVEALEQIINWQGRANMAAYMGNPVIEEEEAMYALAYPDSDFIIALVYDNDLGRYSRIDNDWTLVSPVETAYNDTIAIEIDMDKADELIETFDNTELTIDEVEKNYGLNPPATDEV